MKNKQNSNSNNNNTYLKIKVINNYLMSLQKINN